MRLHIGQGRRFLRRGRPDFNSHELGRHRFAQVGAHCLKQIEGFSFVLVQRVALSISTQTDDLAQMLEHDEMLSPEVIERLQQNRFFDIAQDIGAPLRHFGGHVLVGATLDARL